MAKNKQYKSVQKAPALEYWVAINAAFKIVARTEAGAHRKALQIMRERLERGCVHPVTFNTEKSNGKD